MRDAFVASLGRALAGWCVSMPFLALIWWAIGSPPLARMLGAMAVGFAAAAGYLGQ